MASSPTKLSLLSRLAMIQPQIRLKEPIRSVSIVIPVYNEAANLEALWRRLSADGRRRARLRGGVRRRRFQRRLAGDAAPDRRRDSRVRVVELARNFGQHSAILAGFRECRGDVVVTLDADLQNPPEEIPRLLEAIDAGNDVVGGWREERQDQIYRRLASLLHNSSPR